MNSNLGKRGCLRSMCVLYARLLVDLPSAFLLLVKSRSARLSPDLEEEAGGLSPSSAASSESAHRKQLHHPWCSRTIQGTEKRNLPWNLTWVTEQLFCSTWWYRIHFENIPACSCSVNPHKPPCFRPKVQFTLLECVTSQILLLLWKIALVKHNTSMHCRQRSHVTTSYVLLGLSHLVCVSSYKYVRKTKHKDVSLHLLLIASGLHCYFIEHPESSRN